MTGSVILAAGNSSRLGQPKQLILFRGNSLVRHTVNAACEAGCSPVVVVIGNEGKKVHRELEAASVIKIQNKHWRRGIGSSIRIGIKALLKEVRSLGRQVRTTTRADSVSLCWARDHRSLDVVLLVCDQPFVNAHVIRSLITLREKTKKDIIASSYAHTLGVPALFDRSFFRALLSLGDEAGAKSIILQNRERVAEFEFPEGKMDIDTWEDCERLNGICNPERSEGSRAS
jgi:molybdenum cofactor cytidylyltransferase